MGTPDLREIPKKISCLGGFLVCLPFAFKNRLDQAIRWYSLYRQHVPCPGLIHSLGLQAYKAHGWTWDHLHHTAWTFISLDFFRHTQGSIVIPKAGTKLLVKVLKQTISLLVQGVENPLDPFDVLLERKDCCWMRGSLVDKQLSRQWVEPGANLERCQSVSCLELDGASRWKKKLIPSLGFMHMRTNGWGFLNAGLLKGDSRETQNWDRIDSVDYRHLQWVQKISFKIVSRTQ